MTEKGNLCIKCMKEIEDFEICPYCGFSQSSPYLPECLEPKTVLQDRYFIGAMVKKTGEGITYMGYDNVTDARVLIKEFFPTNIAGRDNDTKRIFPLTGNESKYKSLLLDFVDLAKIMTRSRSLSAIIPVWDVFEENNTVYTVSQFVEAITLREYLMQIGGEMEWEQAKAKFAPVISAINTIHSSVNLNHLGISPETILVDKAENFRISDYSIEALRTAKSEIIPEIYSGYAAPEQYNSANWLGEWSDVYAIAAVIYKAVTGTMPPESTGRIVSDNLVPAYKLNKNVPVNISNALMKAMNVSPEKRTQSVDDLIIAFAETAEFLNPAQPEPEKPEPSKSKWVWISIIGASLIVVGLIVYFILSWLLTDSGTPFFPDHTSTDEITSAIISSDEKTSKTDTVDEVSMKDLVNKTLEEAKILFPNIEFVVPEENYEFSDQYAKGAITWQSVNKGEKIASDSKVILKISKGPETVEIGDYIGKTLIFAKSDLDKKGIKYKVEEVQTNDAQEGTVIKTDPSAGFLVKVESQEITVFVAVKASTPTNTSTPSSNTSNTTTSQQSTTSVGREPID